MSETTQLGQREQALAKSELIQDHLDKQGLSRFIERRYDVTALGIASHTKRISTVNLKINVKKVFRP